MCDFDFFSLNRGNISSDSFLQSSVDCGKWYEMKGLACVMKIVYLANSSANVH